MLVIIGLLGVIKVTTNCDYSVLTVMQENKEHKERK